MLGSEILEEGRKIIQQQRDAAERKGERKGKREGKRELLRRLLRHRFGDLPQDTLARVDKARTAKLELWGEQVLTAKRLADVFRGTDLLEAGGKIIRREREEAEREGERKGKPKGEREMLCRLLCRRFGRLPLDALAVVDKADTDKVELWAERVLTAKRLADVFREA